MYIYESHLSGLFTSEEYLNYDSCYCEQCGNSDWLLGNFNNPKDFLKYYADNIQIESSDGGYSLDYIFESVLCYFENDISKEEAVEIIRNNRTLYDDTED